MKNVLIVSGHTDLNNSVANKVILQELQDKLITAEFDFLDRLYPGYRIDVKNEQQKLVNADVIVLQFPIFWYTMPSLMSRWIEEVFQYGFSHGIDGDKLKGKKIIASLTTGALEEAYHKEGRVGHEIEDFLLPLKITSELCGMEFSGFIYTGGVSYQNRNDQEKLTMMKDLSALHAKRLVELIDNL